MSTPFELSAENLERLKNIVSRYPVKQAALLPTLHLIQEQLGYISPEAEQYAADKLELPVVEVRNVISFYSMFATRPLGKYHIKVCDSLSCAICGSSGLAAHIQEKLGVEPGGMTDDGTLSWEIVPDCLGACELAPMIQLNGINHGPLTTEKLDELLEEVLRNPAGPGKGGRE